MNRADRKLLLQSNFGRNLGWDVLRKHEDVAVLTEPKREDMFWFRYKVEALVPEVFEEEFWKQKLVYRNRGTGHIAANAHPGGELPTEDDPYVLMRALYIPVQTNWRERLRFLRKSPLRK